MESFTNTSENPIEMLSPEKQTSLDYNLNIVGEDFNTLNNSIEWYRNEGDNARVMEITGLITSYGEAESKDDEKQIAKNIASMLG